MKYRTICKNGEWHAQYKKWLCWVDCSHHYGGYGEAGSPRTYKSHEDAVSEIRQWQHERNIRRAPHTTHKVSEQ